jgi:flagellar basal body-associated protein FliL
VEVSTLSLMLVGCQPRSIRIMIIIIMMIMMIMMLMKVMMMMMMMMMMMKRLTFVKTRYPMLYVHSVKEFECSDSYRYINVSELDASVSEIIIL